MNKFLLFSLLNFSIIFCADPSYKKDVIDGFIFYSAEKPELLPSKSNETALEPSSKPNEIALGLVSNSEGLKRKIDNDFNPYKESKKGKKDKEDSVVIHKEDPKSSLSKKKFSLSKIEKEYIKNIEENTKKIVADLNLKDLNENMFKKRKLISSVGKDDVPNLNKIFKTNFFNEDMDNSIIELVTRSLIPKNTKDRNALIKYVNMLGFLKYSSIFKKLNRRTKNANYKAIERFFLKGRKQKI